MLVGLSDVKEWMLSLLPLEVWPITEALAG